MEINIGMARMVISMAWTNQATLMCTWVGFFSVAMYVFWNKKPKKIDNETGRERLVHFRDLPSPMAFPVFGNMLQLSSHPHLELTEWAKIYGPFFRVKMGFKEVLIVTGFDNIKTALVKKSASFAGRPELETSKLVCQGLSLTFSDYSRSWEHQKIAAKAAVSCYTSGRDPTKRTVMENSSVKHANCLVSQLIETAKGQEVIVDPRDIVLANASNAVCSICFGQDFDIKDKKLEELLHINRNFDEAMGAAQPVNFWPILRHCPIIARSFKKLEEYFEKFWSFLSEVLDSHWETYDDNNMRDLTDCLYRESEKEHSNNNEKVSKSMVLESDSLSNGKAHADLAKIIFDNSHGNKNPYTSHRGSDSLLKTHAIEDHISESEIQKRIMYSAGDIFGAGYDTMFTTLHWSLLYLAAYPNTQAKMLKEINRAMSPEEHSSFRLHGSKCAYTLGWIYEVLRHTSLSPLLVPHTTTEATELENCFIPKGTMVYFNTWQANKDPKVWDDPEEFKPERFLIENGGTYSMKPNAASKLLVWGAGKRKCLGHELSKHLLFIFITTIVKRIDVQQSKIGVEPVVPWPSAFGLTLKPKDFKICITERQYN